MVPYAFQEHKREKYSHVCMYLDSRCWSQGCIWKSEKQKDCSGNAMGFSCSHCTDDQCQHFTLLCITEPFLPDRDLTGHRQYSLIYLLRRVR